MGISCKWWYISRRSSKSVRLWRHCLMAFLWCSIKSLKNFVKAFLILSQKHPNVHYSGCLGLLRYLNISTSWLCVCVLFQNERSYQKQPTIFQNKKRVLAVEGSGKEKLPRYHRNVGLGFKTPREVSLFAYKCNLSLFIADDVFSWRSS